MRWTNNHAPASTISRISSVAVFPLSPLGSKIVPDHVPHYRMPRASPALNRSRRTPKVPATVAAMPGLPLSTVHSCTPPAGQRKLFSRACPRRPKRAQPHSLAGASGSGRGCAPVGLFLPLWAGPGSTRVCRCSGFNIRDVFPAGCVAGRAEGAARAPGHGLRCGAELDRSRPQPVVDGVERFDQLVVPWLLRIE